MWNKDDAAVAAAHSVDVAGWESLLGELLGRCARRFRRQSSWYRAGAMVRGLLAGIDRKNCWTLAEQIGDASPDGLQYLLARARWDHDGLRDDVREFVGEYLADPDGVLVVDETGDLKKGTHTVGVQRQYTGTAGRIENAQVSVHLTYATPRGHALIDRELYLPKVWTADRRRCHSAGVPDDRGFATKPTLAGKMITTAVGQVQARWVAGDEVYGADPVLRQQITDLGLGYVLAVACSHRIPSRGRTCRVDDLTATLPSTAWRTLSAGTGAKGKRNYRWAQITIDTPGTRSAEHTILVRRHPRTGELAFFRCYSPTPVTRQTLVSVAGLRWRIEESFQAAKSQTGLDDHQVRTWNSWYRWHSLVMLAHAFLAVAATISRRRAPTTTTLIQLSVNEIRKLFTTLATTTPAATKHTLHWSTWRRQHQAHARTCHYHRRGHTP